MLDAGFSAATARKAVFALRRCLAAAVADRRIMSNPAADVPLPSEHAKTPRFLSQTEVERLVAEVPERYQALVLVGAYAGLRWGEAVRLTRASVDVLRSRILVRTTAVEVDGKVTLGHEPKTKRSQRAVPVARSVMRRLEEHLASPGTFGVPPSVEPGWTASHFTACGIALWPSWWPLDATSERYRNGPDITALLSRSPGAAGCSKTARPRPSTAATLCSAADDAPSVPPLGDYRGGSQLPSAGVVPGRRRILVSSPDGIRTRATALREQSRSRAAIESACVSKACPLVNVSSSPATDPSTVVVGLRS